LTYGAAHGRHLWNHGWRALRAEVVRRVATFESAVIGLFHSDRYRSGYAHLVYAFDRAVIRAR
jgi:hypothetical protein